MILSVVCFHKCDLKVLFGTLKYFYGILCDGSSNSTINLEYVLTLYDTGTKSGDYKKRRCLNLYIEETLGAANANKTC